YKLCNALGIRFHSFLYNWWNDWCYARFSSCGLSVPRHLLCCCALPLRIVGGTVFGIFSALHYWWPKMFGRILNETLGKITFWFFFFGFHLTFFIQHFLGLMGMPRRYWVFLHDQGLDLGNVISSIGAFLMGVGVVVFLYNIVHTAVKG